MLKTCVWVQAAALSIFCTAPMAAAKYDVRGFSLTELGDFVYDANPTGGEKTQAQQRVDQLHALGVRHLNLHPRAVMRDPRGMEVIPVTPLAKRSAERMRYFRLMKYIHGKGMTVGIEDQWEEHPHGFPGRRRGTPQLLACCTARAAPARQWERKRQSEARS